MSKVTDLIATVNSAASAGTNLSVFTNDTAYSTTTGTVTSVALSVPTGLSIAGSPITTTGTLALTLTAGYSIPLDTDIANWDTAFGWGDLKTTSNTYTGVNNFSNTLTVNEIIEKANIVGTAYSATQTFDLLTGSVFYCTADAANDVTVNFRGDGSNTLDSILAKGESMSVAILVTMGATLYELSAVQVDGTSFTPKWPGGVAPIGTATGIDVYIYSVVKKTTYGIQTFDGATDVDDTSEEFTITAHGFVESDYVQYDNGGGTSITGLTTTNYYYVKFVDVDQFQLSLTDGGAAILLTDGIGAAHTLTRFADYEVLGSFKDYS
jgi:hypothetical protein